MATFQEIADKINKLANKFYLFYTLGDNNVKVKSILTDLKDKIESVSTTTLLGEIPIMTEQERNDLIALYPNKAFLLADADDTLYYCTPNTTQILSKRLNIFKRSSS